MPTSSQQIKRDLRMTASEAAARWGITKERVIQLIRQCRVKDARLEINGSVLKWTFPEQDKPPAMPPGRKKSVR
mgnify:CR=1 FL=1